MRAWLFGIMHNLHVDAIRKPRLATVPFDDATHDIAIAPTQGDQIAVADLASALAQLPIEQKEVMLLIALEDMSYAEVALTLGIPAGTVMSRLSRGRERLRAIMEGRPSLPQLKLVQ
jgi:RNA polymerase sigma factor (sigma-70 family)